MVALVGVADNKAAMILLKLAHYLRPYRWRVIFSIACMVTVSVLATVNVLMVIPVLKILLNESGAVELTEATEVAAEAASEAGTETEAGAVLESASGESASAEDDFAFVGMIPRGMRDWAGGALEGPVRFVSERREQVETWYREKSRSDPFSVLLIICAALAGLTAIKGLAQYASQLNLAWTFFHLTLKMREDLFRKILAQDFLFFTEHSTGYLTSRIKSDVREVRGLFNDLIFNGVQQPLNLILFGGALYWLSPQLTLVTAFFLLPVAGLIYLLARTLRKNLKKQKKKEDEFSSFMTESLHNIRVIKAFGTESDEVAKFIKRRRKLIKLMMARRAAKFAGGPAVEVLGSISGSAVMLFGAWTILGRPGAIGGTLSPSEFFAYLYLMTRFYEPVKGLSKMTMKFQGARVSAARILEILNLESRLVEAAEPRALNKLEQGIEFRDVSFAFKDKPILSNISLTIERGQIVALVGGTGSGKTTIANLLARLFDPTSGQILIDGVDLREFRIHDLRQAMGIVTQQTILFDDTVARNIDYGFEADELSAEELDARIRDAARDANADEFILALDGGLGYETRIGVAGSRLSGGQAQRIAIARALLRKPQIMIFDEATSSLDSVNQAQVQEAINRVLADRTALIISHRLSTVRKADKICVLDEGRIVEQGTHDELMERGGAYFELYRSEEFVQTG